MFVFGDNIMSTSIQTMITLMVHPSQFGKAMGMMTLFGNVARACGPFMFAPMFEHVSKTLPWFINAGCKLLAVSLCLLVPLGTAAAGDRSPEEAADAAPGLERALVRCLSQQGVRAFRVPGGTGEAVLSCLRDAGDCPRPQRTVSWAHFRRPLRSPAELLRDLRRVYSN